MRRLAVLAVGVAALALGCGQAELVGASHAANAACVEPGTVSIDNDWDTPATITGDVSGTVPANGSASFSFDGDSLTYTAHWSSDGFTQPERTVDVDCSIPEPTTTVPDSTTTMAAPPESTVPPSSSSTTSTSPTSPTTTSPPVDSSVPSITTPTSAPVTPAPSSTTSTSASPPTNPPTTADNRPYCERHPELCPGGLPDGEGETG